MTRLKPGTDSRRACHCRHRASCTHRQRWGPGFRRLGRVGIACGSFSMRWLLVMAQQRDRGWVVGRYGTSAVSNWPRSTPRSAAERERIGAPQPAVSRTRVSGPEVRGGDRRRGIGDRGVRNGPARSPRPRWASGDGRWAVESMPPADRARPHGVCLTGRGPRPGRHGPWCGAGYARVGPRAGVLGVRCGLPGGHGDSRGVCVASIVGRSTLRTRRWRVRRTRR